MSVDVALTVPLATSSWPAPITSEPPSPVKSAVYPMRRSRRLRYPQPDEDGYHEGGGDGHEAHPPLESALAALVVS